MSVVKSSLYSGLKGGPWLVLSFSLLLWAACSGAAAAQDSDAANLPEAESILDKAVEALGGAEAIGSVRSQASVGMLKIPAMGIEATMHSWVARPNLAYTVIESPALGEMTSGSNGTYIWENLAMTGPRILEGDERAVTERQYDLDGLADWRQNYEKVVTIAEEAVDGEACYKLILTPKQGPEEIHYYSKETGLPVKHAMTMATEMGEIPIETFLSDFRKVDGLMIPFQMRQVVMQMQEMVTVIDSLSLNVDIPEGRFDLPKAIQALAEKKEAKDSQEAPK